jgi:hypothetical protein
MLAYSKDPVIVELSERLRDRKLYQCLDIMRLVEQAYRPGVDAPQSEHCCAEVFIRLEAWQAENAGSCHQMLLDHDKREPYKRFTESKGPLNQMRIRSEHSNELVDIVTRSLVVNAIPTIEFWRVYVPRDRAQFRKVVDETVREVVDEQRN